MKKSLLIAFLTAVLVCGFALAGTLHVGTVHAATEVKGTITLDTTWTKANSPYVFDQTIVVAEGVTLTIEPGVTVDIGGGWLHVAGRLIARGSSNSNIIFFSDTRGSSNRPGYIFFTPTSDSWNEQTGLGSIIENAVLNFTYHPAIDISNSAPK